MQQVSGKLCRWRPTLILLEICLKNVIRRCHIAACHRLLKASVHMPRTGGGIINEYREFAHVYIFGGHENELIFILIPPKCKM